MFNGQWVQLDERVLCSIRGQIAADTGKRVLKQDVRDVLNSDFSRLSHPVREYVEALPAWDSRDRVKELCRHVSAQEPQYFEWTLHKWLVAAVATWMSDLSSNHEIFVLIGAQGIYKTTFFRHLLPPQLRMYFWENAHNSFSSKDDHLALAENCLVEIEEIDLQSPRDISELKALATSEKVKERRPYARFREEKHRLASFCGSGNQERFLSDETGNRRWLCHKVDHIDDPRTWGLDYDQLYAQLRDELRQGFRYWFDPDEQRRVERQNEAFRIESDEEQLIRSRLRRPSAGEKVTLMNSGMICQFLNGGVVGRGLSTRKVGIIMTSLGFRKVHTMQGNFFEVYQIPLDQIQATLAMTDTREGEPSEPQEGELPF
jgi:predicted P-loop ATPase